jgi:hypothetical protein
MSVMLCGGERGPNQGAIREDRLVFPIPPGTHWSEVQAVAVAPTERPALEGPKSKTPRKAKSAVQKGPPTTAAFSLRFGPPPAPPREPKAKRERTKKDKVKIDPALVSKARELRDRYLEHLAANPSAALSMASGKYDVSRALQQSPIPCLPAAA